MSNTYSLKKGRFKPSDPIYDERTFNCNGLIVRYRSAHSRKIIVTKHLKNILFWPSNRMSSNLDIRYNVSENGYDYTFSDSQLRHHKAYAPNIKNGFDIKILFYTTFLFF